MRFEIFAVAKINIVGFWVMVLYGVIGVQYFGAAYCLHF
jgi:hypothetical protein